MCGIAGFLHFDQDRTADRALVKKMADTLIHRGPDGEGFYCHKNLALGHRRLSIIDLTTGDQPKFDEDRKLAIIFNGEIYNYIELREELKGYGHKFQTDSDTEVILKAYKQWGVEFQNKLNGMWAIALWDESKQQLLLSRDRIGEKPLFYSIYDRTLVFGSEIKSLLAYGIPPDPRLEVTELYLTLGYVPVPYTFYKNVKKLEQGHYLLVRAGQVQDLTYWDVPQIDEENMIRDKASVYKKFEELLYDSVRIRMRSDVPFGAFLSGGLDSSSIVALMSEMQKEPVKTFTIGFKEKVFDESRLARQVAEKFKTDHFERFLEPSLFDQSLSKILNQFDEPFGDSSAIPTGNVSQIAVQKVKMVLTGDGGDEVLSGYNAYIGEKFARSYQRIPGFVRRAIPPTARAFSLLFKGQRRYQMNRMVKLVTGSGYSLTDRISGKLWCDPALARELIGFNEPQIRLADYLDQLFRQYPAKNSFYGLMYFHMKVLLPDDFLTKVDRMSMSHSLETRVPFLDHRLVEYMMRVHMDVKMEGYQRKSVLRNTIGKRLPSDLLMAPKKGFSLPLRDWFRQGEFSNRLEDLSATDFGLNKKVVKRISDENKSGVQDYGNFIWMLFVLRGWMNKVA